VKRAPRETGPSGWVSAVSSTLAVAVFLLVAASAQADPRWWWSDIPLTQSDTDSITPHIDTAGGEGFLHVVTWAEIDPAGGDLEIWLTATPDDGCTFCRPTRLTDNDVDDTNPRVGAVVLIDSYLSVQVAFESAGNVIVAYDSTTVYAWDPPQVLCDDFDNLGPTVIANNQYVQLNPPGQLADQPDICGIGNWNIRRFHAVWHETVLGNDEVFYARDLASRGGAGWAAEPPRDLTALSPAGTMAVHPAISCDLFTDPDPDTGNPTRNRSGVNIAFIDRADGRLYGLRSVDCGATLSPGGDRFDAPPAPITDSVPGVSVERPQLSAGYDFFSMNTPIWVSAVWEDFRAGPGPPRIGFDARHLPTPAAPGPDWQAPDEMPAATPSAACGGPAVTTRVTWDPALTPVWVGWHDDRLGWLEIHQRGGVLSPLNPVAIDFTTYPIPPVRSNDPALSVISPLTHCTVDAATFDCLPDRTAGDALDIEFVSDMESVHAVWSDSRDGARNIYYKRTDEEVWILAPRLATGCSALDTAFIDATFDLISCCPRPHGNERMGRYLVYYGTDPGGPYLNAASPIEVLHDPALGSQATVRIDGLSPGQTYQVIVVPEDEARNLFPPGFDPDADEPNAHNNEAATATPANCAPEVSAACAIVGDRCASNPALDGNGNRDPGELIDLEIMLTNPGTAPVTNYTAVLEATGATIVSPLNGAISVAAIPPGQSLPVAAVIELPRQADGAGCGDPVDLALRQQASDGPMSYPDDDLAGCDFALGDPAGAPCTDCAAFPEIIVRRCGVVSDSCSHGGPGDGDGVIDPGESIVLEVEFENVGGLPAVNFTALVDVTMGAAAGGDPHVGPVTIDAGGTYLFQLGLDVTAACGDVIEVDVVDLESDGGAYSYPSHPACDQRTGRNFTPVNKLYKDNHFFMVPDGGAGLSVLGVDPVEVPLVESARLVITGWFPNRPNLQATLLGPAGTAGVTSALDAPLDITADYNGPLGGAGHYDLQVEEAVPDALDPSVSSWSIRITDTAAECTECEPPPQICLHRFDVTSLSPLIPPSSAIYQPRTPEGIALRGGPYQCPFGDGDLEQDPNALTNGTAMQLYQVNRPIRSLRLERAGTTIRFRF